MSNGKAFYNQVEWMACIDAYVHLDVFHYNIYQPRPWQ